MRKNSKKGLVFAILSFIFFNVGVCQIMATTKGRNDMDKEVIENNKKLIVDFYDAFARGDVKGIEKYITDDFIMHVPGNGLNAGEYWGKDGFQRFLKNISSYSGGKFTVSIPSVAVNNTAIFTREEIRMNRKDNPSEIWLLRFIMEYRIKDGLISEAWTIPADPDIYDAFWTPGSKFVDVSHDASQNNVRAISDGISSSYSESSQVLVEQFYHYFWKGDINSMGKLVAPNFIFSLPGKSSLAGIYEGWSGYKTFRDKLLSTVAGDKYKLEWDAFAASNKDVFVKEYIRMNRRWDQEVQISYVILHFEIDQGKIIRINDVPIDSNSYDLFFTKPAL